MPKTFIEINKSTLFISVMEGAPPTIARGLGVELESIPLPPNTLWAACSWVQDYDAAKGVLIAAQQNGQFQCLEFNANRKTTNHHPIENVNSINQIKILLQDQKPEYALLKQALDDLGLFHMTKLSLQKLLTNPDKNVRLYAMSKLLPLLSADTTAPALEIKR